MARVLPVAFITVTACGVLLSLAATAVNSAPRQNTFAADGAGVEVAQNSIMSSITPLWSSAFIDTIGINSHFSFARTLGHDSTNSVLNGLETLGIRHIRQNLDLTATGRFAEASALGVKFDVPFEHCLTGLPNGPLGAAGINPGRNDQGYAGDGFHSATSWMNALQKNIGFANVDSVEECNEPNGPGNGGYDHNWQTNLPLQAALFQGPVQSHGMAFVGPGFAINNLFSSFGQPAPHGFRPNFAEQNGIAYQHLNPSVDISNHFNYQNIHVYHQRWPGYASPTGLNAPSIMRMYNSATGPTVNAAGLPYWVTETGWSHDPHDGVWVPLNIQARWIPLLFLDNYKFGIQRTYLFNDVDASPYLGATFTHYGIMTYTDGPTDEPGGSSHGGARPTVEFTALENFINLLKDPARSFTPVPISLAVSSGVGTRSQLFEKSNGLYLLALWKDQEDYVARRSAVPQTQLAVPPESVTITVADQGSTRLDSAVASTFNDAGGFSNRPLRSRDCNGNHCFSLQVSSTLTVLQIAPKGFTPQTPVPSPTPFGDVTPTPSPVEALAPTPRPHA